MSKEKADRARKLREHTVTIEEGATPDKSVTVTFLRPKRVDMHKLTTGAGEKASWAIGYDQVVDAVVGWNNMTDDILFGADLASPDTTEFSKELWAEACGDRIDWVVKVQDALMKSVLDFLEKSESIRKN